MPEYIERDKLVGKFLDKQFSGTSSKIDIAEAIRFVNSAPTADVAEVKHGKWIKHKPDPILMDRFHEMGIGRAMNRNSIFWTCSCCGGWGTPAHNFCSNCGAKMDKE